MSWTLSIFFNALGQTEEVITQLEKLWLIKFRKEVNDITTFYTVESLGIFIDIFPEHGMEDDQGLAFTQYKYEIDISLYAVQGFEPLGRNIAFYLAEQLFERLKWPCIVVEELQTLLAEFRET
jgi:hypothetical protein